MWFKTNEPFGSIFDAPDHFFLKAKLMAYRLRPRQLKVVEMERSYEFKKMFFFMKIDEKLPFENEE